MQILEPEFPSSSPSLPPNNVSCSSSLEKVLVVSIHDVSPQTQAMVEVMLDDLKKQGVKKCSLLVVPNHHHLGAVTEAPHFMKWLQAQQKQGHEIVLHGFYHLRPAALEEGTWTRWMTQHYTTGEGEFYDLGYEAARTKLQEGKEQLCQAGIEEVVGFIAPAWLLSQEAEQAVKEEGFSYTTRLGHVIDLKNACSHASQSMVYSVRSAWRRQVSLLWNELLFRYAQKKRWSLLRLGLHPPDWNYNSIRRHALVSVQRALCHRVSLTYEDWMNRHSLSTSTKTLIVEDRK